MKKGCLLALLLGAALIGGIIFVAFQATKGAVKGADDFLALVGSGKLDDAYASTATGLKKAHDRATFEQQVRALGLDGYVSSSWASRSVENDTGKVEGTVETKASGRVPLTIQLVKEDGAWKVLSFGRTGATAAAPMPKDDDLKRLVTATLGSFADAVKAKDFTAFHGQIAAAWKKQVKPEELKDVFGTFLEREIDLTGVKGEAPVFDKPTAIGANGVLAVSGYVPGVPAAEARTEFELEYAYEHPDWKLVGINVRTR